MNTVSTLLLDIQGNVASLKKSLDEGKSAMTSFKEQAEKIGEMMAEAFAAEKILEWAKQAGEYILEVGENVEKVEAITELTGAALKSATAEVMAMSTTFKTDFNATLQTTNALSKQFGISFNNASTIVEQGLALNTANAQEFLDIVKTYSKYFADAGMSASEFAALVTKSFQAGIGDSGFVAIQKGIQNIRLMNKAAQEAMLAVGMNAEEINRQIEAGTITPLDALKEIVARAKEISPTTQEAGMAMAVLGKEGQKLSTSVVANLLDAKKNMAELVNESSEGKKAMLELNDTSKMWSQTMVNMFGESAVGWTKFKTFGYNALITVVQALKETWAQLMQMVDTIKYLGATGFHVFTTLARLIKDAFTLNNGDLAAAVQDGLQKVANDYKQWGEDVGKDIASGVAEGMNADTQVPDKDKNVITANHSMGEVALENKADSASDRADKLWGSGKDKKWINATKINFSPDFSKIPNQMKAITESIGHATGAWVTFGGAIKENVGNIAVSAISGLGDVLGKLATGQKATFKDLVGSMLDGIKKIINGLLAQAIASEAASNAKFGIAGLAMAGIGIAGIESIFQALPAFKSGTDNFPGGWAQINERGGEIVNLPSGSQIIPADKSQQMISKMSGGGAIHVTIESRLKGTDIIQSVREITRRQGNQ